MVWLRLRGGNGPHKDACSREYILAVLEDILAGDNKLIEEAESKIELNLRQPKFVQNLLNCAVTNKLSVDIRQLAAVVSSI